jgi:hypothetical protein
MLKRDRCEQLINASLPNEHHTYSFDIWNAKGERWTTKGESMLITMDHSELIEECM